MKNKVWYVDYINKTVVYSREATFNSYSSLALAQARLDLYLNKEKTIVKAVTLAEKVLLGKDVLFSSPEINNKFLVLVKKYQHIDY